MHNRSQPNFLDSFGSQLVMDEASARAVVEADLAGVVFRQPVVDYVPQQSVETPERSGFGTRVRNILSTIASRAFRGGQRQPSSDPETPTAVEFKDDFDAETWTLTADRQWGLVTGVAMQLIAADPSARRALVGLVREPLSEDLPLRAMSGIPSARMARIVSRTGTLNTMLSLPSIPTEAMTPDLPHAIRVQRRDNAVDSLTQDKIFDDHEYNRQLENIRLLAPVGMTKGEKKLALRRFKYARDAKLLGLVAELYDEPTAEMTHEDGLVSQELTSGAKLVMTEDTFATEPHLLDPASWQHREQLKDRVYRVWADGRAYILKERKTAQHQHTKDNGHRDGNTSEEEFAVAQRFTNLGEVRKDDIELRWEKPLGYVEFPDGYQFCLFENDTAVDAQLRKSDIVEAVLNNREQYQAEYEAVQQAAKTIAADRPDLLTSEFHYSESGVGADNVTFEEFARAKGHFMQLAAAELIDDTVLAQGYVRNDNYNYSSTLGIKDGRMVLDVLNFDFEYIIQNPGLAQERADRKRRLQADGTYAQTHTGNGRDFPIVASYALAQRMGWNLPPKK